MIFRADFAFDALGVLGLGLVAISAARLSRRYRSWGGPLLTAGAVMLMLGRLWVLVSAETLTPALRAELGDTTMTLLSLVPVTLLTAGLAAVVWGLWGHEQWLREDR